MTNHLLLTILLTAAASPALPQGSAPPPKGPQPVSRAVYMSRIDIAFNAVDTNKDGFTDRAEIEAAERKAMTARKAQLIKQRENTFRQLDKDKNGSLTLAEFNGPAAAQALPKSDATQRLQRFDTNKDGKISTAESRAPASAQFDRLDTNKDNILSVEEQQSGRRR